MALPMHPMFVRRTVFDTASLPIRPEWAIMAERREQLKSQPPNDLPDCIRVADIRRDVTASIKAEMGRWVRWESLPLHTRVDKDTGAVWVLLQKIFSSANFDQVKVISRWLYFEEFMANYPKAAQALRPVDQACYRSVQWAEWMEDD